jgi:hypothetical protein
VTTRNAAFLPRFQALCERYGFKPTWLTNYEMACCPVFHEFGRDVVQRGAGEIGMHLHAWNSPPIVPLTDDDLSRQPYLIEFPPTVMRDKIARLTELLESTFGCKMLSHRAGRWALDRTYARLLIEAGYRVDCSVTPHVSWAAFRGADCGSGGCDFSQFPTQPYFLDPDRIDRPGSSPLLELPMTIRPRRRWLASFVSASGQRQPVGPRTAHPSRSPLGRLLRYLFPPLNWLRPDGRNLRPMLQLVRQVQAEHAPYAQFMLHSSELMPGGSPRFPTARRIERLYAHLEQLFEAATHVFRGRTLGEFWDEFAKPDVQG